MRSFATRRRPLRRTCRAAAAVLATAAVAIGVASRAGAQEPAPPKLDAADPARRAGEATWSWQGQTGGAVGGGNTSAVSFHSATRYVGRFGSDQVTAIGVTNWISVRGEGEPRKTVFGQDELYGRVQYDRFFGDGRQSVLVSAVALTAQSSGFDAWLTGRIGYERILFAEAESHELWVELTYDGSSEWIVREDGRTRRDRHFARAFVGTLLEPLPGLELEGGVQALFAPVTPEDWRAGAAGTLTTSVTQALRLGLNGAARYFHEPVGERVPLEGALQFVLVFRLSNDAPEGLQTRAGR